MRDTSLLSCAAAIRLGLLSRAARTSRSALIFWVIWGGEGRYRNVMSGRPVRQIRVKRGVNPQARVCRD